MKYNKVRGILRAKQGSQVPKYAAPSRPIIYNPNIIGSMTPTPKPEAITNNPIGDLRNALIKAGQDYINKKMQENKYFNPEKAAANLHKGFTDGYLSVDGNGKIKDSRPWLVASNPGEKSPLETFKLKGADFLKQHGTLIFNAGLDMLGLSFNNVENSGGVDTAFLAMDMIGLQVPIVKLWSTALKGINSLGGKNAREFSINLSTAEQVGSSYGGSMSDITNAAKNSGKKYGLFSGSKRRKANRAMDEAERQQNIMTDIADDARDILALSGNDFNYTNYMFNISGGYDQRYMRAAKSGMKLLDKIDFIKNEVNVNPFINLDTKEIEWNPIIEEIEEWEPVIEFKEGGSLPELWEPEIEIVEEWEPIITDYVEEFKDGGSIKEELETPEIEETNQKNLIPEGALHKNKHHMEHTEGLTLKGIPVIDNDGEQLAEIELDEIIFTLEVTKKLEELYKEGTDEAAIEAGKLLVKEILFNTDDRTGLIAKCEKGGKINEVE